MKFNPRGLTLIVGSRSKKGKTYNGVGKSLVVELLHFCLGAKKNDELETKIPQWEFTLEFDLVGEKHQVMRNTSNQGVVYLDHVETKLALFNQWMESRVFSIPSNVAGLSFRPLISRFLRRGQKHYVDPREVGDFTPYETLVRNAFLLGIDVELIARKAALRRELKNLQDLRKNFKNDPLLRDFYSGGKDADIQLGHLERQISELEKARNHFIVAENYYELQKSADVLAVEIETEKNDVFLAQSAIENIDRSMKEQPDLPLERVTMLYGEMTKVFRPDALKRLEAVSDFHKRLLENRLARLSREKLRLLSVVSGLEMNLKTKQMRLDQQLRTLGQATALDQYTAVVNQIATLTADAQKLRDYKAIQLEYSNRAADLDGLLSDEVKKTNAYMEETKSLRERRFSVFTEYVSQFYPKAPAGITLHNDDGNNQTRFHFDVRVENDSSDGINEVRIFCYDLTLLTLQIGHKVGFLFHDSRLYTNMDVRQRATLFRTAHEISNKLGYQYIATLNPDSISGMDDELDADEMKAIIDSNIVLELKDDSPAGKLLGIQVDMQYDR
ncbi:MAG: DUF2326 domain-containing protein [Thiobacillus sp.]|nr:DUF2326 domain-containing protein [Thiobacillus sp.]